VLKFVYILNWVDAQANLPSRARWIAKADVASKKQPTGQTASTLHNKEGFLFSDSVIDPGTMQAYLDTEFRVFGDLPFVLHVGQRSEALDSAHKSHRVECSAFITAWNPYSEILSDDGNQERQQDLAKELSRRSLSYVEGLGQHKSNQWPGEESFLVFGLTLEAAKTLGTNFEQNAIVWIGSDAIPELILLR
jgi:hypothetical protein